MEVNDTNSNSEQTNGPAYTARRGRLKLTVWANDTEQGPRFSSEITRSWKEDDGYRSTTRLDERDLLPASRLAQLADDWVTAQRHGS